MTIASLLGTSFVFVALGWSGDAGRVAALSVGCVVAIAASIAGDTSQDLKTGFILGATPRRQQVGELVGVLTSATFVCATLLLLNQAYGFGTKELAAPQAMLMRVVVEGVLDQSLPWGLVGIGALIAVAAELVGIQSLAFAVGVYLPVAAMVPVFLGGALSWWITRGESADEVASEARERGVLFGSGLVGGEGLLGVLVAGVVAVSTWRTGSAPQGIGYDWLGWAAPWLSLLLLIVLAWCFVRLCRTPGRGT
jgi:putative OPT family oligopeptide transporter